MSYLCEFEPSICSCGVTPNTNGYRAPLMESFVCEFEPSICSCGVTPNTNGYRAPPLQ